MTAADRVPPVTRPPRWRLVLAIALPLIAVLVVAIWAKQVQSSAANDPTAPLSGGGTDGSEQTGGAKGGSKVSPSTADAGADNPTVAFGGLGGAGKPS